MNQRYFLLALGIGLIFTPLLATVSVPAQTAAQVPVQGGKNHTGTVHTSQQHQQDEGERIFKQNCSRCHTAPEGFSPSISGTIVRHMRVRASLSRHDEQELLRFFNP
jgi:cytochrome c5